MAAEEGIPAQDASLLRRVLDAMPNGIVMIDRDDVVIQVNAFALNEAPTIVPGVRLRDALDQITHMEQVDRLLIRREVATFPGRPGGPEYHWMVWRDRNAQGEVVLTFWDTDWNDVMNERRAAFTMAASHELRGPLTTIQGFAEILNMDTGNLSPEQAEAATIVERTARHLSVLVEDVFDLSRNSFGELRLDLAETDLGEVIRSVVSVTSPLVQDRDQSLTCRIEGELPTVEADQARSTQMLSNLVNNASIHNPDGTSIRIVAGVAREHVRISVEDDGDGLPFEDPGEAFRAFRRGDHTVAGDRTGSGIGLSITKRLIELHRGYITVESNPGEGSRFTLGFPVDRATALTPGEPGPV